ncbi:voltage-gated potassium channel [Paraburkholderia terricola]|uniref:Voltage-gated potassium channel n=1 Tax=Paraburkholderia terricola TaxID=169427 RepID=A0A1M6TW47_9BURK|nr:potassium transporter TrkA [Paraburkholderia terricola]MDR6448427.1 voltage-gated potassium channel [Paraburkholderia terricola]MDR6494154.1 voltage-gated potassium channel [Paraburkholderia terricola]SDO83387.1 voltage-gated potassium channel [Paraburkholderia sediminicola]SHK61113.1 voltage-gated potassium channel [Paraburkholderia terricola]
MPDVPHPQLKSKPRAPRFRLPRRARSAWQAPRARILFTRPAASPQRVLLQRIGLVAALCVLAFVVLYLDRDGLRDANRKVLGIVDLMYFTMVTVATVGYGDIVPVTARARLIDAFFIVPIRIIIWFVFLGTAYQFVIQRVIEEFRMKRLQKQLRDHVVICGYGLSGSVAVRELLESGFAATSIVVIDPQQAALEAAASLGVAGLLGDPSREDLLQQAQVRIAKAVIIAVADDATAILLTLTVRSVAPQTKIVVRIREQTYQRQLRQAGANVIVSSTRIGGLLLADAVDSDYIVPFINDLLSARGRVNLIEREASAEEVGRWSNALPGAVVVGLVRAGRILSFYDDEPCPIETGDLLMLIQSARQTSGTPVA